MASKTACSSDCERDSQLLAVVFDERDSYAELEERVLRASLVERAEDACSDVFMGIFGFTRVGP